MKTFSETARQEAASLMERYPTRAAALIPIMFLAQKEFGHIDEEAERAIAELMGISPVSVREVSGFYFMIHKHPPGKFHLQICHNITCTMMEAEFLLTWVKDNLGIEDGQRSGDGLFSLERVECLGACDKAPVMLVNETLYTHLTLEKFTGIIEALKQGKMLEDSSHA
jgi:NADH-quinone oxidoreductase subunit E